MRSNKIRMKMSERIFNTANLFICTIYFLICFYPFYYVIINSLSDPSVISSDTFILPSKFSVVTYIELFRENNIPQAFIISVSRTVIATLLCVFCSSLMAYLLTQQKMVLRKLTYRYIIITLYVNAGIIPWYLTMKTYGLRDNYMLYIFPYILSAYFIILIKTYMEQIPRSIEESASIDGAGFFTIFFKIMLPLSKPVIMAVMVFSAVNNWNTWRDNYFLIHDPKLQTIQLVLYSYLNNARAVGEAMRNNPDASFKASTMISAKTVQMTIIVISVFPIMLVYPFLQKYFTKGIMLGAIKG